MTDRDEKNERDINTVRPGASFRRRRIMPTRRALTSLLIFALIAAGLAIDLNNPHEHPANAAEPVLGAASADATSSAWFCPMLQASRTNPNASAIVILNPGQSTLSGEVTYFPQGGPSVDVPVNIAPHSRIQLHPGDIVDSQYAAALLRLDGGGAAVEESVSTPTGPAFSPCATQASSNWYFAEGSTLANTTMQLGLFNPFYDDAIADVSFVTSDGNVQPDQFQGVVIPARSFTSLNVGENVRRREWIATSISARSGRIVAAELQTGQFNGVTGGAVTLGATSPSDAWYFPDGVNLPGFTDQVSIFNPNPTEAEATVQLITDKGSITPFQLHVPANGRIAVNIDKEERVPKDATYGLVVRSTNGVNIVAQRTTTESAPGTTTGAYFQVGATEPFTRWIVPLNETRDPFDDWVYILNPSGSIANVRVTGVQSNGQHLVSDGQIQAGRRLIVHVDEFAPDSSNPGLIIESDQPIVTGRTLYVSPGIGLNGALAVPVRQ